MIRGTIYRMVEGYQCAHAQALEHAWRGIELSLEPYREALVAADGDAARRRVLAEHTYAHLAAQLERLLEIRAVA